MKLLSLKGQNIGLLKGEFEFEFDQSLTVITGPIGCGKSTILTMIRASLTNSFPGTASSWASWGASPQEACYFVASWRIGSRVLHIAKCVSGDRDFAAMNIPRLRIENDDGTIEDVHSSREALERTHSLIPVPASIIDGHLIVDQDSITAPVASTPAKFKETIHTLTRTSELELMRLKIKDLLCTVTVPDVEGPLAEAQAEVNRLTGDENGIQKRLLEVNTHQSNININEVNADLETQQLLRRNNERMADLELYVREARSSMQFLDSGIVSQTGTLAEVEHRLLSRHAKVEEAKKTLYSLDASRERYAKKLKLQDHLWNVSASIDDLTARIADAPACEKVPADYKVKAQDVRAGFNAEIAALKQRIALVEQGNCPTCGQSTKCPVSVEDLKDQLKGKQLELEAVTRLQKEISDCIDAWERYDNESKVWAALLDSRKEEMMRITSELESLADAVEVGASEAVELKALIDSHAADESQRTMLKASLTHKDKQRAELNGKLQEYLRQIEDLPKKKFDPEFYARLMHNLETYRKLDGVRQGLVGELSATQKTLDRAKDRLKVYLDRKAKIEPTLRFREVLQLSEKALVKDALPKLLSAQYMGKLNERIQFYLSMINAEFTAHINSDLEFMAKKSDGLVHKANRLSGGQKQQASVCYLLAVNDVFASTLGVLALDEPSGAMQESNSQDLAEAFNYLANLGQRTGRQFIVITHSAALAEYGCKQIRLEPSK